MGLGFGFGFLHLSQANAQYGTLRGHPLEGVCLQVEIEFWRPKPPSRVCALEAEIVQRQLGNHVRPK